MITVPEWSELDTSCIRRVEGSFQVASCGPSSTLTMSVGGSVRIVTELQAEAPPAT